MLICDKCGKSFEKGKFCTVCGGPIREFFTVKQTNESSAKLTCSKCGKTSSGGKFCIFCASEFAASNSAVKPAQPAASPVMTNDRSAKQASAPVSPVQTPVSGNSAQKSEAVGMVCPKCKKTFEKGKFCTSCGGDLVPANSAVKPSQPAPAVIPPNAQPVVPVNTQPSPAQPIHNAAPAASNGSAQKNASGMVCSSCGKTFEKGKFCTSCGGELVSANGADKSPMLVGAGTASANNTVFKTVESVGSGAQMPAEIPIKPPPAPADPSAPAGGAGSLRCENCGKMFEKGKFCTSCGGSLVSVNGSVPVVPAPAPAAPTSANFSAEGGRLRCTSCGNIMAKGKFCTSCGGSLAPMDGATPAPAAAGAMHCPKCGRTFESGKFCTVCGISLVN